LWDDKQKGQTTTTAIGIATTTSTADPFASMRDDKQRGKQQQPATATATGTTAVPSLRYGMNNKGQATTTATGTTTASATTTADSFASLRHDKQRANNSTRYDKSSRRSLCFAVG
jgi:hypothetical protein